ncbi:MAG: type II toxin-antitoxin system RelE/ParE family toxin [Treponema sp.]|nr:type II toxin-antitoxin system RelE/ParE family toxin [Treponema sp.]
MGVWEIITTEYFDAWLLEQTEDDMALIRSRAFLLGEEGPNLGRPYADTLKGSKKLANLKELRAKTDTHEFRVAYIFDPERKGLLLIGGDKKGKNQKKFYKDLIREAEQIYTVYLEKKAKMKEK